MQHGIFQEATKRQLHRGDIILLHFTPTLYSDLQVLALRIAAAHLTVGPLENYITT